MERGYRNARLRLVKQFTLSEAGELSEIPRPELAEIALNVSVGESRYVAPASLIQVSSELLDIQ
jgi:hypothetical protein